jgi:hypothetical protein
VAAPANTHVGHKGGEGAEAASPPLVDSYAVEPGMFIDEPDKLSQLWVITDPSDVTHVDTDKDKDSAPALLARGVQVPTKRPRLDGTSMLQPASPTGEAAPCFNSVHSDSPFPSLSR